MAALSMSSSTTTPSPSKVPASNNSETFATDRDLDRQTKIRRLFFRRGMVTKNARRMIDALVTVERKEGHNTRHDDIKVILILFIDSVNA